MSNNNFTFEDLKWLKKHKAQRLIRYEGEKSYEIHVSGLLLAIKPISDGYECELTQNKLYYVYNLKKKTMLGAIKESIKYFQKDIGKINRSNDLLMKKVADLFGGDKK